MGMRLCEMIISVGNGTKFTNVSIVI
jgi:hypothetical protein